METCFKWEALLKAPLPLSDPSSLLCYFFHPPSLLPEDKWAEREEKERAGMTVSDASFLPGNQVRGNTSPQRPNDLEMVD